MQSKEAIGAQALQALRARGEEEAHGRPFVLDGWLCRKIIRALCAFGSLERLQRL